MPICGAAATDVRDQGVRARRPGARELHTRDEIVDRPFEPLDERGGHAMSARSHVDGRCLQHETGRHLRHSRVDVQQRLACAFSDIHTESPPFFHQLIVDQFLIPFQNRERIEPVIGGDGAHRRQGIAFLERTVENHRDHAIAKLAVDRLIVVPLTVHPVFQ